MAAATVTPSFAPGRYVLVRLLSFLLVAAIAFVVERQVVPSLNNYDATLIVRSLLYASLAVSLNLINGITGQFSVGHAAFFLVGAYVSGYVTRNYFESQDPLLWITGMTVVGGVAAAIAGIVVGLPSLRLRGDYLAVATLGFGEIIRIIVQNQDGKNLSFGGLDLGGAFGLNKIDKLTHVWHVVVLFILIVALCRNLLKTSHGLSFLAVREDELAAEATGVNTTRTKVVAFVLGAAMAGMVGTLFAHHEGFITPVTFDMSTSFLILTMVVIGGTGSITGAALAGAALKLLEEALRKIDQIPAIDLLGYIVSALLVLLLVKTLRRSRFGENGRHVFLSLLGAVALAGAVVKGLALSGDADSGYVRFVGWAMLAVGSLSILFIVVALVRRVGATVGERMLTGLGWAGALIALVGCYVHWFTGVSVVIKVSVIAMLLALAAFTTLSGHGRRGMPAFGAVVALFGSLIVVKMPVTMALHSVPFIEDNLKDTLYSPNNLRMAIFAFLLVVVMLVRPIGVLGHHEFSWDLVKRMFGMKHKQQEIAV